MQTFRFPPRPAVAALLLPLLLTSVSAPAASTQQVTEPSTAGWHLSRRGPTGVEERRAAWLSPEQRARRDEFLRRGLGWLPEPPQPPDESPWIHFPIRPWAGPATTVPSLAADVLVNDKTPPPSCFYCGGRPPSQAEVSVAAYGPNMLVSWNDIKASCEHGGLQGLGYSTDGGASFRDVSPFLGPPPKGLYRGDGVVAVNQKSGDFYFGALVGLAHYFDGAAAARLRIRGDSLVVLENKPMGQVATQDDLIDKPWICADSVSGNVYAAWAYYFGDGSVDIQFQAMDAALNPLRPVQTMVHAAPTQPEVNGAYVVTGPRGELYVAWLETLSYSMLRARIHVRRSNDFGATFGPDVVVTTFVANDGSGGPGSDRTFAYANPFLDVDRTDGPHRGRLYVVWDACTDYFRARFDSTKVTVEVENNNSPSRATPFVPGGVLHSFDNGDYAANYYDQDYFKFYGRRGQTFVARTDSLDPMDGTLLEVLAPPDTLDPGNYQVVAYGGGMSAALLWTLPADGPYYFLVNHVVIPPTPMLSLYSTALLDPVPGELARDQRDQCLSWSDDGVTWSPPVRVNDSEPWFDGIFPSVAVDGRGRVHVSWYDFRDDPISGGEFSVYMASSGDGGVTWGPNRRVSDASSYFSVTQVCGTNNQGDYQQIIADGDRVVSAFTNAQLGDPDIYVDATQFSVRAAAAGDTTAAPGTPARLDFALHNGGNATLPLGWRLEDDRGWLSGGEPAVSAVLNVAAGSVASVTALVSLPSACDADSTRIRLVTFDPYVPGYYDTVASVVRCPRVPLPVRTALSMPRPNPSNRGVRLSYSLPRPARVDLAVYSVDGARVRTLASGTAAAGVHPLEWDARRGDGRAAAAGVYFLRLEVEGQVLRRQLVLMR